MQCLTTSEKQTLNVAKKFARRLKGGEVIGLVGELGAGKTIFVKGLAAGLGVKQAITSPTFVLMKIYKTQSPKSSTRYFVHVDAYRIRKPEELLAIGIEERFNCPDSTVVIEWADKIKKILPKKTRLVTIVNKGVSQRIIKF